MSKSKGRKSTGGPFSATGDYLWYALSNGLDEYKDQHPVLDLRRKVGVGPVCCVLWLMTLL